MAKVTAPMLSFGGSGTLAKTIVYSSWKGRAYTRRHVTPANPQSTAQTLTRGAFSFGSNIWKNMGPLGIAPWDRFAQGQVKTGRNAMMGRFVENVRGEVDLLAMTMSPGAKGGPPPVSAVITPGSNQLSIAVTAPTPPTGWTVTSAIAMAILDQDPASGTDYATVEVEDLTDPYACVLTGLTASVLYVAGAWLKWAKPDGSIAYSPALMGSDTPTV